ncbi:unnamed protein product [Rhizoctonia solani]|uniref:Uncharacterized protein n=1 Tax=Rhizoctonia solani TaxID=456999 RepID=A0A8H3CRS4_9AGAM|nr:unnamed protein product [Rhizoctonia solani]
MLRKIMGEGFLDRLTVLLQGESNTHGDLSKYIPPQESPIYPLYCSDRKPRTMLYDLNHQSIERMLGYYAKLNQRLVRLAALDNFIQGGSWKYSDIPRHLRELFPEDVGPRRIMDQPEVQSRLQEQETKIGEQRALLLQKEEELSGLRSIQEAEESKHKELRNLLAQKEDIIMGLESTRGADQNQLRALQALLSQKEKEMADLQSTHDAERLDFRNERVREKFNHGVALKSLQNKMEDREAELSKLESNWASKINDLELSKNAEIRKLRSEKDAEITGLQAELQAKCEQLTELETMKNEEISKLTLDKDSEIERLRNEVQGKGKELAKLRVGSDHRIQELMNEARAKDDTTEHKPQLNGAATKTECKQENEIDRLRTENFRISAEYASLRNHVQLEENTEQADITTALGDINRLVEEFGGSLTEDIEKYMERNPSERVFQPQDLLGLFVQGESETDLKFKQDPYELFEYAVQATICSQIYTHLFKPFHPFVAEDEKRNTFITQLYEQMTYQGE